MNTRLRRSITDEESRTYEEDGVVWLPAFSIQNGLTTSPTIKHHE